MTYTVSTITRPADADSHRFFSIRQAAAYLGMSAATVRKYSDLGDLACRRVGRNRMFRREDLDYFIDSRPKWV